MAAPMVVGSLNVRVQVKEDSLKGNGWEKRYPVLAELIQKYDFDIVGTQEPRKNQLQDLSRGLPGYSYFGIANTSSASGEYAAIFYKKERLLVLDSGFFWFSETPEQQSKGWDAVNYKNCNWGKFQDKQSDSVFYVFNVHFDHKGQMAQYESAVLLLRKVKEIAGDTPVILLGDFNASQTSGAYQLITSSGFSDAYQIAETWGNKRGTLSLFDLRYDKDYRIDHIFVNRYFNISYYSVLIDSYLDKEGTERLPTDHYPVLTRLNF
ncbi:MAG: endonuclease/exonuclease/phosphatase family protein [Fibrobacter sp.]|nr:endonuclease/exonuclease/phosphatase family protein [Fibrobacter sp.]